MPTGRLQGQIVLITAAAQGIGRASALACAAEGARVIATDINQSFLDSLAAEHAGIQVELLDVRTDAAVASLAADYVKAGLRANALCPGTVDTPSLRGRIASAADPVQAENDFIARQPMGRPATVQDISPMVVYLASDESRFVTGQTLLVDGDVTI